MSQKNSEQSVLLDDHRLVEQCRLGDPGALEEIYHMYKRDAFLLALSLVNDRGGAEDVVQDTFIHFSKTVAHFKLTGRLRAYLMICVANRSRNYLRDSLRRRQAEASAEPVECVEVPPERVVCNEEMEQLRQAMADLSYEQREVVLLHMHGQMAFPAIAESLALSTNTVKSRYRYGMERLRRFFTDEVTL